MRKKSNNGNPRGFDDTEGILALRNAIIEQAAKDYVRAKKILAKENINEEKRSAAQSMANDCHRFFLSQWFQMLSNMDGKFFLQKLDTMIEGMLHDEARAN